MATLRLEIVTIEGRIFDDQINMVVAPGIEGMLGILPRHAPLLTALNFGELQIKRTGEADEFFAIGGGVMEVQPDHVIILANSADKADDIDIAAVEAARKRAEERLAEAKSSGANFEEAEESLRRQAVRAKVAQNRRRRSDGPPLG